MGAAAGGAEGGGERRASSSGSLGSGSGESTKSDPLLPRERRSFGLRYLVSSHPLALSPSSSKGTGYGSASVPFHSVRSSTRPPVKRKPSRLGSGRSSRSASIASTPRGLKSTTLLTRPS